MIILYFGGYQSFLLCSSGTWVFKSAEQPNPSTRWKGELHCRRGRLLRTQPWLEPQCQPEEEEMIAKLYTNAMQCNAQPWKVSLHRPRSEEGGTSPAKKTDWGAWKWFTAKLIQRINLIVSRQPINLSTSLQQQSTTSGEKGKNQQTSHLSTSCQVRPSAWPV